MVSLLIVTHVDFWKSGAGHRARITSLVGYLKDKVNLSIVYAGYAEEQDQQLLNVLYPEVQIALLAKNQRLAYKEYVPLFETYFSGKVFDAVMVEYLEMSFVLAFLPEGTLTLLDTHDVVSDRIQSFKDHGIPYDGIQLSHEEEMALFACFNKVIAIQEVDYKNIARALAPERVLLVPHAVHFPSRPVSPMVNRIGYIASGYAPNVQALTWFLNEVWAIASKRWPLTFEVYGAVCNALPEAIKSNTVNVNFHGFTSDLDTIYKTCDVIVNPVLGGAGLKIKSIEALGNGLPLITTTHGSTGLSNAENCFLVADTAEDFINALTRLINDFNFRKKMSERAYAYSQTHFSAEQCYRPLLTALNQRD